MAFPAVNLNTGLLRASMGPGAENLLKQVAGKVHRFSDKRLKTDKSYARQISNKAL